MTTNLTEQLAAARNDATAAQEALNLKQHEFDTAVAEQRFSDAEALKAKLPALQQAFALAEAQARALASVLDQLAAEEAERQRQAAEAERRRQAAEIRDTAMAAEREAMADLERNLADVDPGLAAVRESLRAAVAAEARVTLARQDAHQAQVVLGEAEPGVYVAQANRATAKIEANRLLAAILHGKQL